MRADCAALLGIALLFGVLPTCVPAEEPAYGKVETFQPGKKYNCVPASDGKGWDCREIGKADVSRANSRSAAPLPSRPAESANAPATHDSAAPPYEVAPIHPSAEAAPAATALPSYLTNASATGRATQAPAPAPSTSGVAAAAAAASTPVAAPAQSETTATHMSVTPARAPTQASTVTSTSTSTSPTSRDPMQSATPAPASEPAPQVPAPPVSSTTTVVRATVPAPKAVEHAAPVPTATPAPAVPSASPESQRDFLALPGEHYVIELAAAPRQADLASARDSVHVPQGKLYELHLRQNEADQWLLVWGDFDSIQTAREARNDWIAGGAASAGWPRRIAPLQTEVRRARE